MKVKKLPLLDIIITSLQAGKYPSQIAREQKVSKQKISYYIRKLKEEGLIKKIGYGVWETNFYLNQVANSVRGHAFMWKVKNPKRFNWENLTKKRKIKITKQRNKTIRIILNERKIWLCEKNIIIYEPESFFGRTSIETKKFAVLRLLKIINKLEENLGISLKHKEGYIFKVARQHYSLVKNSLAIQCNENGEKINVYNKEGLWFLIDNSYNLEEAETVNPNTAMIDNIGVQNYFNSHKETGWKVTPKFTLQTINGLTRTQVMNAENIVKHQRVLDEMLITLKKIQKSLDAKKKEEI